MKEEWLFPGAVVPVDMDTTLALVTEIKRLVNVIGGMALAQVPPPPSECKTEAEQTAYAFGWWKALESVRTEQPAQEPDRQALQANGTHSAPCARHCEAQAFKVEIRNLKAKLAQPAQEPVGSLSVRYFRGAKSMTNTDFDYNGDLPEGDYELYTAPPQRPWVGLTDEEIEAAWRAVETSDFYDCVVPLSRAVEAKLKEKNS
jgi:hypothetical protein